MKSGQGRLMINVRPGASICLSSCLYHLAYENSEHFPKSPRQDKSIGFDHQSILKKTLSVICEVFYFF